MRTSFRVGAALLAALAFTACGTPTERQGSSGTARDATLSGAESEFETDFGEHSVPYEEISSGGPPKDGILAIDEPRFVGVEEAGE